MPEVHGNLEGIKKTLLDELTALYDLQLDSGEFLPHSLAIQLCGYSALLNREIGVYVTRDGEIADVRVGKADNIDLPDLRLRRSERRLSMIRCIHTHPGYTGELSDVDISALLSMRFDAMVAIGAEKDGRPNTVGVALLDAQHPGQVVEKPLVPFYKVDQDGLLREIEQLDEEFRAQEPVLDGKKERAVLIGIESDESLSELKELAQTAGAEVVQLTLQKRLKPDAGTYIGRGKADELSLDCQAKQADLAIVDDELTGAQQKNLEEILRVKVVDRTTLILDIFAGRARTREGKLQVEIAQLKYRSQRLMGQGLVLSRLAGGIGTRGPGESKLEVSRRRIRERINDLEVELSRIERQRSLRRRERERNKVPIVALVGYTNAGKSTLFRQMTGTDVYIENQLFATLDAISRPVALPHGSQMLLVDTVGFIRKLPHELVKAFHATLEEAALADVVVIVSDGANPEALSQHQTVQEVLDGLGATEAPRIDALNKSDREGYEPQRFPGAVEISALTGAGVDVLLSRIEAQLLDGTEEVRLLIPYHRYGLLSTLHEQASVFAREDTEQGVCVTVRAKKQIVKLACEEGARLIGDET